MKYPNISWGTMEAIINKLGGEEGANRFLRGEMAISDSGRNWREQDGVIYFSVTSDGTTGPEWISRLKKKGLHIHEPALQVLRSKDFKPTKGVTREIAVLKVMLLEVDEYTSEKIRIEGGNRNFLKPEAEVACLIRDKFTDEEIEAMGLWYIVTMHEPIQDFEGKPRLLYSDRSGKDGCRLCAGYAGPKDSWGSYGGCAFVVSQVGPQN
jgi:hypothetical protein